MDRYREIREIILNTSNSELNAIRAHIESHPVLKAADTTKSVALITAISENPEKSEVEILRIIGFKPNAPDISRFYRTTLNLINEGLILDINIDKQFEYSNSFRNKSLNRKRLILAEILLKKGLQENANLILDDIVSKSTKYEEFDQVIEAYELRKLQCIVTANFKEYDQIDNELQKLEATREGIHKARKLYQDVLLYSTLPLPKKYAASIETALNKIGEISKKNKTATVWYFMKLVEYENLLINEQFSKASKVLEGVLQNVRTNAPLQSQEREAQILLKMAQSHVLNKEYEKARSIYEQASTLFKKSDYDYYVIVNKIVYLDFYMQKYNDIKKHIDTRARSRYITSAPYSIAQYEFFNGVLLYLKNKPLKAVNFLLPRVKPSADVSFQTKLGMNFCLLKAGIDLLPSNQKVAQQSIKEAFKNIEKIKAAHKMDERDKLILRIFKKLRSRNFDFEVSQKAIADNLQQLSTDPDYAWEPFRHEVVPTEEWFKERGGVATDTKIRPSTPSARKSASGKKTSKV